MSHKAHVEYEVLTIGEVASRLRVSRETIRRRTNDGTIASVRVGHITRIPANEVDRIFRTSPEAES